MTASVKPLRNFGTKNRLDALRVQLMAGEISIRIGQRIREARRGLGLNQRELAVKINEIAEQDGVATPIDNQRISDWERGVNKPSERYMALLASALDKKMSWFWEVPGQETPDPFAKVSSVDQVEGGFEEFRQHVGDIRSDIRELKTLLVQARSEREAIRDLLREQELILEEMRRVAGRFPDDDSIDHLTAMMQDLADRAEADAEAPGGDASEQAENRRHQADG
jgi:transcriptional regulator with XRE-family HTH domain